MIRDVYALYINVGGDESITAYMPADATGNASLMINDVDYGNATIVYGNKEFVISNLVANCYKCIISYGGDNKYDSMINGTDFVISKKDIDPAKGNDINVETTRLDNETVLVNVNLPDDAIGNVT